MYEVKAIRTWEAGRNCRNGAARVPRVYVDIEGENVLGNLLNRHSRPHVAWRELIAGPLTELFGLDLIDPETGDLRGENRLTWRQNAGCSCGCSPAFLLEGPVPELLRSTDVTVTIGSVYATPQLEDLMVAAGWLNLN